jgi:hypothetical protein
MGFSRKLDVFARVAHIRFVQDGTPGLQQCLINAASSHYVAAKKEAHD